MEYIRYVEVRGVRYLRAEDVVTYLQKLAGSEDVDTRKRIESAANDLLSDDLLIKMASRKDRR